MFLLAFFIFINLQVLCDPRPGTVQVGENLFFDRNEITHAQYNAYVMWLIQVFGQESDMWKNALPGTRNVDSINGVKEILPSFLYLDKKYNNHPVVNISFEQATNFCQWRSDRVYEVILINHGFIKRNISQNANNYFTIKKYIDTLPETKSILSYAIYRLPTPEEWDSISNHTAVEKKFQSKYSGVNQYSTSKIFDMFGSVAEMTSVRGLSKGGSFADNSQDDKSYDEPSEWLGFRCICSFINQDINHFSGKLKMNSDLVQRMRSLQSN